MRAIPESDKQLFIRLPFVAHGDVVLPDVLVESYSLIIRDEGEAVGDKIGRSAFAKKFDTLRKEATRHGRDPLGKTKTAEIKKSQWAKWLADERSPAGMIVNEAVDYFAAELFEAIRKFREADDGWRKVQAIAVGGGFSAGRVGRLTIARAERLLHKTGVTCALSPIPHHPDAAGVCGAAYLAPGWMFAGFDAILGVDIGGTNIRCGAVTFKTSRGGQVTRTKMTFPEHWRHADDEPSRTEAINKLIGMLQSVVRKCKRKGLRVAPFIGVGCPGRVRPDGTIDRGAHTLPGTWEGKKFNLPALLAEKVPILKRQETIVVMHNDAVVQGLSQVPSMRKERDWAVLTIGTGLGNVKFTTRHLPKPSGGKGKPAR
jgi:hypothetical protein